MSWAQIREVEQSGVEIASHSHDLHHYDSDNPYGDTAPAVATRLYLGALKRYEDREEYRARIRADLAESQRQLRAHLGHFATTLVWPYGMHNDMARSLAAQSGLTTSLTLSWREVSDRDFELACLPRIMVTRLLRFSGTSLSWLRQPEGAMRAAEVNLDDLYDPDPVVYRAQLDRTITRLRAIGATHVFLDVCSNAAGLGRLERTYFPGHQTAIRADLWSMAAAKMLNARMHVWVRAPSMNLTWAWDRHPEWRLGTDPHPIAASAFGESATALEARMTKRWPTRLSPELLEARRSAVDFFTDLAVYLPIEGVLFDDDALLLAHERLASRTSAGPGERVAAVDGMIADIERAVRAWRPDCRFGRVTGPDAVLADGPARETSQDLGTLLHDADRVVVRADAADPAFARDPARWVSTVCRRAMPRWRREQAARAAAAARLGVPPSAIETVPALLLELPVDGQAADGSTFATRLPALLAEARRAGFESFSIGPVTPANGAAIPARVLEAAIDQGARTRR
jgi:biofilm PGA synthesis lipoprotein PgaB